MVGERERGKREGDVVEGETGKERKKRKKPSHFQFTMSATSENYNVISVENQAVDFSHTGDYAFGPQKSTL